MVVEQRRLSSESSPSTRNDAHLQARSHGSEICLMPGETPQAELVSQ